MTIPFTRVNRSADETDSAIKHRPAPSAKEELGNRVLSVMKGDPNITKARLSILLDVSESSIDRAIATLKKSGAIERIGSNKSGYWHVIE